MCFVSLDFNQHKDAWATANVQVKLIEFLGKNVRLVIPLNTKLHCIPIYHPEQDDMKRKTKWAQKKMCSPDVKIIRKGSEEKKGILCLNIFILSYIYK